MGKPMGRPRGMTREDCQRRRERILARYLDGLPDGLSLCQVAAEFGLTPAAVRKAVRLELARRGLTIVRPAPRVRPLAA